MGSPRGMFQFQTGSIKRQKPAWLISFKAMFQFQTGSIKSFVRGRCDDAFIGFNSKLVRLKDTGTSRGGLSHRGFQFQTGSIKRLQCDTLQQDPACFNSKLVRLKAARFRVRSNRGPGFNSKLVRLKAIIRLRVRLPNGVSIPNWFD